MTYPTYYTRSKDFSEDVGNNSDHTSLNEELDLIALSLQQIIDNIKLIQRDDNELANATVGVDQLADGVYPTTMEATDAAIAAQAAAEAAQAAAEAAETDAEAAETDAEAAAVDAVAAKELAEKWASEDEDTVVADGKYSAYHWAQKAEDAGDVSSKVEKVPGATVGNLWKVATGGVLADSTIDAQDVIDMLAGSASTAALAAYDDADTSIANTEFVQRAVEHVRDTQKPVQWTPSSSQAFTSSGTFTVPVGVTAVYVTACGGGGGGGSGGLKTFSGSGGKGGYGGNAVPVYREKVTVTPEASVTVTIGAGGAGGAARSSASGVDGYPGSAGGSTSFGSSIIVSGGGGGSGGATGGTDGADGTDGVYTGYLGAEYDDAVSQTASGLALELATKRRLNPFKRQQPGAQGTSASAGGTAGGTGVTYGGGGGGGGGAISGYTSGAGGSGRGGYVLVEW